MNSELSPEFKFLTTLLGCICPNNDLKKFIRISFHYRTITAEYLGIESVLTLGLILRDFSLLNSLFSSFKS